MTSLRESTIGITTATRSTEWPKALVLFQQSLGEKPRSQQRVAPGNRENPYIIPIHSWYLWVIIPLDP